jgi:antirestriction protein
MTTKNTTDAEEAIKEQEAQDITSRIGLDVEIVKAALELGIDEENMAEAYSGQFSSDKEFAQDMADSTGAIRDDNAWPYTCIDWDWAAKELMYDYSEQDGYYFRTI